ncbi:uncharacterized protein DEA37_0001993 [Paragonimus westermani]|uniref:Uncharacterized protein n=1 Tax=Paragonimus westermani TaxID=34504 RepID=A0A5J4NWB4_9TREM|nr:uncharacterized protein DEA37_0001993 [Paragonimus westermani]
MERPVYRIDHAFEPTKIIQFSLNSAAIQRPMSSFSDCVTQINRFFPDYHKMFDGLPNIPLSFFKKTPHSPGGSVDDKNSSHVLDCRTRIPSLRSCTKVLPGPSKEPIQDSLNLSVDSDKPTVSAFKGVRRSTPKSDPGLDMHPRSHSWRKSQLNRTNVGSPCARSSETLPACHAPEVPTEVNTTYMRSLIAESSTIADRETNNEVPSFVVSQCLRGQPY